MKKVIAYILLATVLIGSGCIGTVSEHLTPGRIDKDVVAYNEEAGTGRAEDYKGWLYPSLAELKKLQTDLDAAIKITFQELEHLVEQKKLQADILKGVVSEDIEVAVAREDFLFNPVTGALAIGLSLAGIGAGGYLGLMRKRPQDYTEQDLQNALGEVKGEVTDRDRKLVSIVKSIQNVINAETEPDKQKAIIKILKDSQSPEARATVKTAKAAL